MLNSVNSEQNVRNLVPDTTQKIVSIELLRHEYVQHPCDEESQQQVGSHLAIYIENRA